ncbi:hypothetical protein LAZ67_2004645 [Cordylochernes scorpioides]|uniref:RNase H type-1 domain-containing protein n=1 Tax=Cordylochernes scorpioides TaxID=51811 RepID=A0ABY6K3V7_9ARAC|nr:hypothetical protein LAZ67_2004645 [Cordylochernes scorpioides]
MDKICTLQWIPAHVGIEGNEQADGLAKERRKQTLETSSKTLKDTNTKAKLITKTKIPQPICNLNINRELTTIISRIRTGHYKGMKINPDMTRSYRNCNNCYNTQLTPDHIYPASPLYDRHQSRRRHLYGQGTSVGRYCDQGAWTDLICSMDKTPTPENRLTPEFHRRVKAKTSLQGDDVPIDDTTTKPLFTPQEKGRKGTRDKVPRLQCNPWQKHVRSISSRRPRGHGCCDLPFKRLTPGFHHHVKATTSLQDEDVPIDDDKASLHAAIKKDAKATIYKYHLGLEVGNASHHIDLPTLWERTLAVHRWRSLSRGMSPKEIYEDRVDTLREDAPSYSTVKKWVAAFKLGRISTEDEHRPGRPVESVTQENIDKIHVLDMLDRRMTVRRIEETLGCKEKVIFGQLALFEANPEEFVSRFVTMDETWAHHFIPESKQQSMQWRHSGSPPPKKAKTVPSAGKVMVSVFWDSEGVLLLDFLNKGQTITGNYYANLVKQLREAIKEKRREMLSRKIVYHQDNAPSHRSLQAMAAIYDSGFELLPHAPYSPDIAPSDFHLFPHLKKSLSGIHFRSDEEGIDAVTSFFESLETSFFLVGIKALEHRWKKGRWKDSLNRWFSTATTRVRFYAKFQPHQRVKVTKWGTFMVASATLVNFIASGWRPTPKSQACRSRGIAWERDTPDTSCFKIRVSKGLIGHAVHIRTEDQASFCPFTPREVSVLAELTLGHLRYSLTDVPSQPSSPPETVLGVDRPYQKWGLAMAAALQKIDMDLEQQLYKPKIVDIATAVIKMHGDI